MLQKIQVAQNLQPQDINGLLGKQGEGVGEANQRDPPLFFPLHLLYCWSFGVVETGLVSQKS